MQNFGGSWTEQKLTCLKNYLNAYMLALSKIPFHKIYIDAFSGTGGRFEQGENDESLPEEHLKFFEGSAQVALNIKPRFNEYHFIEKDAGKCKQLESLIKREGEEKNSEIHQEDANAAILKICQNKNWMKKIPGKWNSRGVIFLDPFGCQVGWDTVTAIAGTKALDMWYLFPSGMGALRLMAKDRDRLPPQWANRLNIMFGTKKWEDEFFKENPQTNLFGNTEIRRKGGVPEIEQFFIERLKTIFPHVADSAMPIYNKKNSQMFSLCFAAANPQGGKIAVRIANDLIKK